MVTDVTARDDVTRVIGHAEVGEKTAVQVSGLTKAYGTTLALDSVDLEVPTGVVFGYLGPNGAGKTTTIRLLMGLLRPTAGEAHVLGLDVGTAREEIQSRVGYLPGDFVPYGDLTGEQYLSYLAYLRGTVDWKLVDSLCERLGLDPSRQIRELSHGNRQKVGLIQAFMHRPQLLVLDEPTIGLDPLVQREFLAILREVRSDGHSVFLSSHLLAEVEAVADIVAILREGRLVVVESIAALKARAVKTISLTFSDKPPATQLMEASGVQDVVVVDGTAHVTIEGSTADLFRIAAASGIENIHANEADLERIFLDYYSNEGTSHVS